MSDSEEQQIILQEEQTTVTEQNILQEEQNSIQGSLSEPQDSMPEEKNLKRKAEESVEEEASPKKPKIQIHRYLSIDVLDKETLKQCFKFTAVFGKSSKAQHVYFDFDRLRFSELHPDYNYQPRVSMKNSSQYYKKEIQIEAPDFFLCPFGYSPYIDNTGKISNTLRISIDKYKDPVKGKKFIEWVTMFDEFIKESILENKSKKWPLNGVKDPEKLTPDTVEMVYGSLIKEPKEGKGDRYMPFAFTTQLDDKKAGIKKNEFIANVNVWNDKKEIIATQLTEKNMVPKKKEDKDNNEEEDVEEDYEPILDKECYVKPIFAMNGMYFSNLGNGVKLYAIDIMTKDFEEEFVDQECPF